MVLYVGEQVVHVQNAFMESTHFAGSTRPCLRFDVGASGVTSEEVTALTTNPILLYDDEGNKMGEYEGYNTLASLNLVLVQVQASEVIIADLEAKIRQKDAEKGAQIAALNEHFGVEMANARAQFQTDIAQALSEADSRASENLLNVQRAFEQQIRDLSNRNDLIIEEVVASVRQQCGYVQSLEEYDPDKPYISGDRVPGFICIKYSRGNAPDQSVGTFWAHYISPEEVPEWEGLTFGLIIHAGTVVYHNDAEWACTSDHLVSAAFEPVPNSPKWEKI